MLKDLNKNKFSNFHGEPLFWRSDMPEFNLETNLAKTVMLTTKCEAKCLNCPFSISGLPHVELSINELTKMIRSSSNDLIVISGGEPFQHTQIEKVLDKLSELSRKMRIATGGFISLNRYFLLLKKIKYLDGISMGTDVLTANDSVKDAKKIWLQNLKLLNENSIPYSITITVDDNKDYFFNIFEILTKTKVQPQFYYIRYSQRTSNEFITQIQNAFKSDRIIFDCI